MTSLVEALIKEGLITQEQLQEAKDKQVGAKRPIQELLVEMGFIKEEDLMKVSSKIFRMPISNLNEKSIDTSATKIIPYEIAKRYGVFPVLKKGNVLVLAMSNPEDVIAKDNIKSITDMEIEPILSTKSEIAESIERYYHLDEMLYDLLKNVVNDANVEVASLNKEAEGGLKAGEFIIEESAIVKLVNLILVDAVRNRASDIHIEPQEDFVGIRYRVDGDLRDIIKVPKKMQSHLVSRIKILAELDIAEARKPQDGRIRMTAEGKDIDLRISTIPTFHGEKIVLRILDTTAARVQLDKLGLEELELNILKEMINKSQGMILVTGPTGSGKTSTIYAALNYVKNQTKNIVTIEDPIEYLIGGINQMQVNPIKEVTFANGLRSILRQDPNIILVGEIRDAETAEIAFRASLTGHLVFTTLHTNNAVSSITRLLDIGLESYLISSSIIAIIAQRLLKTICPYCKEQYSPEKKLIDKFNIYLDKTSVKEYYRGKGCEKCSYTGFLGRTAIFEILRSNENIRSLISERASEDEILKEAKRNGLRTLAETGVEKITRGITTLEEVARIADIVEERSLKIKADSYGRTKVLVVDDDILIRKMVREAFEKEKDRFEFTEAQDGEEALKYAYNEKPDLLVSDLIMPKMDGYKLIQTLRSHLESASIPIIVLTSQADKESEIKGLDVGADDYITKPFDKDRLLARAKMLLRRIK